MTKVRDSEGNVRLAVLRKVSPGNVPDRDVLPSDFLIIDSHDGFSFMGSLHRIEEILPKLRKWATGEVWLLKARHLPETKKTKHRFCGFAFEREADAVEFRILLSNTGPRSRRSIDLMEDLSKLV